MRRFLPTRQAHKRVDTKVSPSDFHPFSIRGHGGNQRTETIRERQRIFSTVGAHSVRLCLCLYAVSDSLLLHRTESQRRGRHKVNCPKGKRGSSGGWQCRPMIWLVAVLGTVVYDKIVLVSV